jgi:hypothetical protein
LVARRSDGKEVLEAAIDDVVFDGREEMVYWNDWQLVESGLWLLGLADVQSLLEVFVDQRHANGHLDFSIDILMLAHESVAPQIARKDLSKRIYFLFLLFFLIGFLRYAIVYFKLLIDICSFHFYFFFICLATLKEHSILDEVVHLQIQYLQNLPFDLRKFNPFRRLLSSIFLLEYVFDWVHFSYDFFDLIVM